MYKTYAHTNEEVTKNVESIQKLKKALKEAEIEIAKVVVIHRNEFEFKKDQDLKKKSKFSFLVVLNIRECENVVNVTVMFYKASLTLRDESQTFFPGLQTIMGFPIVTFAQG